MSQPPGYAMSARRKRVKSEPSIKTEDLNSRVREGGISCEQDEALSMVTSPPEKVTSAPSSRRICAMHIASEMAGTPRMVTGSSVSTEAAKSGRTAFLAEETGTLPKSFLPPVMSNLSIVFSP